MANIMQMMQKASLMKKKMQEMQERAGDLEVTGSVAGVSCLMTGKFELKSIKIPAALLVDSEILEDAIVAAVNDARLKAEKSLGDETRKIMADLGLPPGMEGLF